MKIKYIFVVLCCVLPFLSCPSDHITQQDKDVLETVLREVALRGIMDNWGVSPQSGYAVLADRPVKPVFPESSLFTRGHTVPKESKRHALVRRSSPPLNSSVRRR